MTETSNTGDLNKKEVYFLSFSSQNRSTSFLLQGLCTLSLSEILFQQPVLVSLRFSHVTFSEILPITTKTEVGCFCYSLSQYLDYFCHNFHSFTQQSFTENLLYKRYCSKGYEILIICHFCNYMLIVLPAHRLTLSLEHKFTDHICLIITVSSDFSIVTAIQQINICRSNA